MRVGKVVAGAGGVSPPASGLVLEAGELRRWVTPARGREWSWPRRSPATTIAGDSFGEEVWPSGGWARSWSATTVLGVVSDVGDLDRAGQTQPHHHVRLGVAIGRFQVGLNQGAGRDRVAAQGAGPRRPQERAHRCPPPPAT